MGIKFDDCDYEELPIDALSGAASEQNEIIKYNVDNNRTGEGDGCPRLTQVDTIARVERG